MDNVINNDLSTEYNYFDIALTKTIKALHSQDKEKVKEAVEFNTLGIEKSSRNRASKLYLLRAACYEFLEEVDFALIDYTKAIELNPYNCFCYYQRGAYYFSLNKVYHALRDFWKICELKYTHYDPIELIHFQQSLNYKKAISHVEKLYKGGFDFFFLDGKQQEFFIMPEFREYNKIILEPENIHISRTYKRHLRMYEKDYELCYDMDYETIMNEINEHYPNNQIGNFSISIIHSFLNQEGSSPKIVGTGLFKNNILVAGDLGIENGNEFISLTGFHKIPYAGKIELYKQAKVLTDKGFKIWNLGVSTERWDSYKYDLGAVKMSSDEYRRLYHKINPEAKNIFPRNIKFPTF